MAYQAFPNFLFKLFSVIDASAHPMIMANSSINNPIYVNALDPFSMSCSSSDFGNPPAVLGFYRNNDALPYKKSEAGKNFTWNINSIPSGYFDANWTCKGVNSAGTVYGDVLILRVYGKIFVLFFVL